MALVVLRGAGDIDLFAVRQFQPDIDIIEAAGAMVAETVALLEKMGPGNTAWYSLVGHKGDFMAIHAENCALFFLHWVHPSPGHAEPVAPAVMRTRIKEVRRAGR